MAIAIIIPTENNSFIMTILPINYNNTFLNK